MAEIFGNTTATPLNPNAFSGGGSNIKLFQSGNKYNVGDIVIAERYVDGVEFAVTGLFKSKQTFVASGSEFDEDVIDVYWKQLSLIRADKSYQAYVNGMDEDLDSFVNASYVNNRIDNALGDIETALDNVIAIQNSLIGGNE